MYEVIGGDKVLLPFNGEHALSLTQSNSHFGECEN